MASARPIRWLVDGMNVIGSRPDGWWRDRTGAMRRLTRELDAFAAATGDPVTVVFDGRAREVEAGRVDVRFARRRGPDAADDDIAEIAAGDDDPGALRVVTSDARLAGRVRAAGAGVVGAGALRRRFAVLRLDRRPRPPPRPSRGGDRERLHPEPAPGRARRRAADGRQLRGPPRGGAHQAPDARREARARRGSAVVAPGARGGLALVAVVCLGLAAPLGPRLGLDAQLGHERPVDAADGEAPT